MKMGRKSSGGKYKKAKKKKLYEFKGKERKVKLGVVKKKKLRVRGGNIKTVMLVGNVVNIFDGKKIVKSKILNVVETPSNKFLARSNIITKGTIVETEAGRAKVTNRPGQEGQIQAVLLKE